MTVCTADFEAGTLAATIATGDTGSATAWDAVTTTGSSSATYDNTHVAHGVKAAKLTTTATSSLSYLTWSTALGTLTGTTYGRMYFYLASLPASATNILRVNGAAGICFFVQMQTDGTLLVKDNGSVTRATGTVPISTGTFVRLEYQVFHNTSTGTVVLRLYNTADSASISETITSSTFSTLANETQALFGYQTGQTTSRSMWLDDLVAGATAWVGANLTFSGSSGCEVCSQSFAEYTLPVEVPYTGPPVYAYTDLVPSYDLDNVFNKWVVTPEDLEPQIWEDESSQEDYFLRVKQVPSLVTTSSEALNQAQWKSGQFSQPLNRVESITIMPLQDMTDTGQIDAGMGREVGDRITILETPPGFVVQQSNDYVIQHLSGQIDIGPYASAQLTFLLWPASTTSFWIVGDPEQSLAGVSTKPGY